ncbi:ABC transporter thiamine pyrophosphate-binding lipoprotein p37/Cypl [Mesomycoplasma neurolyticum]|uniref:High affinity transport system protein p37 n=1 Tax=Mesomycoplasma neurolyticum TaxID=2120 RepID=A0A449A541_9BACT|nr:hypothetical protein [Mesomycoplasma neurolyticum]VEU59358.1 High affinity transport system protein p37 precursor [Mesomycoplasma neurolyticum]
MNKKRFLLKLLPLLAISTIPVVIASCNNEKKVIKLNIATDWFEQKSSNNAVQKYQDLFNKTMKQLYEENKEKYNGASFLELEIESNSDKNATFNNVETNKVSAGIVNISQLIDVSLENIVPYIQTLTLAFKEYGDKDMKTYKENPENFNIKKDSWINKYLSTNPHSKWRYKEEKWDGAKFQFLYDEENKKVDWYAGMITIVGTEEELKNIRKSWDDKNWSEFSKFGIVHGKKGKQVKWKLANKLFKDHFNLNDDEPIEKLEDKYKVQASGDDTYTQYIDKNKKQIFIDNMYSFAWTDPKDGDKPTTSFKLKEGVKMEVLALTNLTFYDVLIFNKSIDEKSRMLFKDTLIKLSNDKQDDFGLKSGYNGYREITDFETLKNKYKKSFS